MMDQCAVDELYEAFAVLAGSDPDHCSYPKGYMKRQAVFACNTCVQEGMDPAGVCLACANACHDGHDVCELYTKRNFRCDCGNEKFHGFRCRLHAGKEGRNLKNSYNHNYFGRYCSCDRPYPDEGDQVNEEMIQCVVCEDWFHEKHLDSPAADGEVLTEMICVRCMERVPFLWAYAARLAGSALNKQALCEEHVSADQAPGDKQSDAAGAAGRGDSGMAPADQQIPDGSGCVCKELKAGPSGRGDSGTAPADQQISDGSGCVCKELKAGASGRGDSGMAPADQQISDGSGCVCKELKAGASGRGDSGMAPADQQISDGSGCVCKELKAGASGRGDSGTAPADQQISDGSGCMWKELKAGAAVCVREAPVFWPYHWREKLCRCTDCKRMYVETGVPFLLDESDTLLAYEERAKAEALRSDDLLLSCLTSVTPLTSVTSLTSLNHVQQLEVIYQFNELKDELREFLQQSSDQRKEVTPERLRDFLEELQAKKRRRLN